MRGDNRTAQMSGTRSARIVGVKALRLPGASSCFSFLRAPISSRFSLRRFVFVHVSWAAQGKARRGEPHDPARLDRRVERRRARAASKLTVQASRLRSRSVRRNGATSMRSFSSRGARSGARCCAASRRRTPVILPQHLSARGGPRASVERGLSREACVHVGDRRRRSAPSSASSRVSTLRGVVPFARRRYFVTCLAVAGWQARGG